MSRERTIGERGPENTVLSYRAARAVARELRSRGWAIPARMCRGRTPKDVAKLLVGPITGKVDSLALEIAVLCGYMPAVEE